jgi:flagellar secretion chaperone FliS
MSGYGSPRGVDEYRYADLPSLVDGEDPHQLVQLMLDGAVQRVMQAQGALEAGDTPLKCELIGKAVNLVEGLRVCLDEERGGEIAQNLAALYEYMARRLVAANAFSDLDILKEVTSLLRELQTGWREMGQLLALEPGSPEEPARATR